ncbi:uncharacterized protein A4U43_C07F36000 [Asparagus officinalis]|uniref:Uncharacterized protein n=1 Tax=Asparagus officinalis TaxID=4686 RepID=A0A5P1EKK0_ASPOF|nr:uncharacterized protein A4U43_C07F36000 [Asparagus officinalis]
MSKERMIRFGMLVKVLMDLFIVDLGRLAMGVQITFANTNNEFKSNVNDGHDGLHRATGSDNIPFFPSELAARMGKTLGAESERPIVWRPDQVLKEVVSESAPFMAQLPQEFQRESFKALKHCSRGIMESAEKKDEFLGLQRWLERRSALTAET